MHKRVAVIGSGASGMSAAFHLLKQGVEVHVFEKDSKIGGRMSTQTLNGKEVCLGGKNIGRKYLLFREFCSYFGEDDFEDFGLNSSNHQGKKVNTFDSDKKLKSIINFTKDLPFKDLIRLLPIVVAVAKNRDNAYLSGPYFRKFTYGKYKHMTLNSYFSKKLQERLIRPLTVRNNGAEPDEVPVANFGTNICMAMDSYDQLKNGPEELFRKFREKVEVHLKTGIKQLIVENGSVKGIVTEKGKEARFDHVILATPAHISASILENTHAAISEKLYSIRYYPVGIVVTEYEQPVFDSQKRAWTFPEHSVLSNAGSYGRNTRQMVRYTFSGRASRALLEQNPGVEELVAIAEQEVKKHTSLRLGKKKGSVGEVMTHGLCAYSENHLRLVSDIAAMIQQTRGLYLAGDYIEGVSIEACFRSGMKASVEALSELRKITEDTYGNRKKAYSTYT